MLVPLCCATSFEAASLFGVAMTPVSSIMRVEALEGSVRTIETREEEGRRSAATPADRSEGAKSAHDTYNSLSSNQIPNLKRCRERSRREKRLCRTPTSLVGRYTLCQGVA